MSNKKEYKIGETVQMGLVTLVCEEANHYCNDCHLLLDDYDCVPIIGKCRANYRTDNKDVIFKLKEE